MSIQIVTQEYSDCKAQKQFSFILGFSEDKIALKVPEVGLNLSGWKITPFYKPEVSVLFQQLKLGVLAYMYDHMQITHTCSYICCRSQRSRSDISAPGKGYQNVSLSWSGLEIHHQLVSSIRLACVVQVITAISYCA